jgi:hypothetical protein
VSYAVKANNEFHAGWVACLLGEPRKKGASCEAWGEGWDMASESLDPLLLAAIKGMRKLGQLIVKTADE